MKFAGFRSATVFNGVTEGDLDTSGSHLLCEVTNDTASTVQFTLNPFSDQGGYSGVTIPIRAGTTRTIPMVIYKFVATDVVDVVAYRR